MTIPFVHLCIFSIHPIWYYDFNGSFYWVICIFSCISLSPLAYHDHFICFSRTSIIHAHSPFIFQSFLGFHHHSKLSFRLSHSIQIEKKCGIRLFQSAFSLFTTLHFKVGIIGCGLFRT